MCYLADIMAAKIWFGCRRWREMLKIMLKIIQDQIKHLNFYHCLDKYSKQIDFFLFFFPENKLRHSMKIVSHKISKFISRKIKKKKKKKKKKKNQNDVY